MIDLTAEPVSHRHPGVTLAQVRAELAREAALRRRVYPDRVAKGNMTSAEAEHEQAVLAAIAADVERMVAAADPYAAPPGASAPAFTWRQRVQALQRELGLRRRMYPQWTDRGRMTADEGARQLAALEALLDRYLDGYAWLPANGLPPPWWGREGIEARDARLEAHAYLVERHAALGEHAMSEATLRAIRLDSPSLAAELEQKLAARSTEAKEDAG